jgi:hypothetical protein
MVAEPADAVPAGRHNPPCVYITLAMENTTCHTASDQKWTPIAVTRPLPYRYVSLATFRWDAKRRVQNRG